VTRPRFHLLAAIPAAVAAGRRWGAPAVAGVFTGGLLIDLDHLADYVWTRARDEKSHYLAPLHGWELALAITGLAAASLKRSARRPLPDHLVRPKGVLAAALEEPVVASALAGLAAGTWLHLVQDALTNRPRHAGVYSLLYRLRHGFKREITGWEVEKGFHEWAALPWYRWYLAL
jgi:hypothetical protein